jgi:hypothetical protein
MGLATWTFFEGFWLLIILASGILIRNRSYALLLVLTLQIFISSIIAFSVRDMTRSGSFLVPIVFVLIVYLKNYIDEKEMNIFLFVCCLTSFIFPACNVISSCDPPVLITHSIIFDLPYMLRHLFGI